MATEEVSYWPYGKVNEQTTYTVLDTDDVSWAEASEQAQIKGYAYIDWHGITYRTHDAYLVGVTALVEEKNG